MNEEKNEALIGLKVVSAMIEKHGPAITFEAVGMAMPVVDMLKEKFETVKPETLMIMLELVLGIMKEAKKGSEEMNGQGNEKGNTPMDKSA